MMFLREIQDREYYDWVVVRVKSIKVCESETIGDGKKQNVEVADAGG